MKEVLRCCFIPVPARAPNRTRFVLGGGRLRQHRARRLKKGLPFFFPDDMMQSKACDPRGFAQDSGRSLRGSSKPKEPLCIER